MFELKTNCIKSTTNFGTLVTMIVFLAACAGKPVEPSITPINSPDASIEEETPFPESDGEVLPEPLPPAKKAAHGQKSHAKKSAAGLKSRHAKGAARARLKQKPKPGKFSSNLGNIKTEAPMLAAGTVTPPAPALEMGTPPADLAQAIVPAAEMSMPDSSGLNWNYFFLVPMVGGLAWLVQRVRKHRLSRRLVFNN